MPADYKYFDNGEERTVLSVLNPVSLTGVETNVTGGTEHLVTVASTASLFPGMAVNIPNIPAGSFIHAIRSATVIELWRSDWNATTGVFTTSAANAAATAAASSLLGTALGFDPRCLVTQHYARGTWRNTHRNDAKLWAATYTGGTVVSMGVTTGAALIPTAQTYTTGFATMTQGELRVTDELAATPLKRHNGEPWSFFILVSSGGFQSLVPALPNRELIYSGVSS